MKFSLIAKSIVLAVLAGLLLFGGASATPTAPVAATRTDAGAANQSSATGKRPLMPLAGLYRAIKMTSATDGWIVGEGGLIKRYMAGQWLDYPSPITTTLNAVSATPTDAWAVGEGNTILHLVGNNWQQVASLAPAGSDLIDVDVVAPNEVWIIGSPAVMLHYIGGNWSLGPTPPAVGPISWGSPSDAWLVNGTSTAYHYAADSWTTASLYDSYNNQAPVIADSVLMLSPDLGWIGASSFVMLPAYAAQYMQYTSATGWQPWPCVSGPSRFCLTPTPGSSSASTNRPAAPDCTQVSTDIYSLIAFSTTEFYATADQGWTEDCGLFQVSYYLWDNLVSDNLIERSLGETYTHTVALSGSSGNDLWILGDEIILYWNGTNITATTSCANPYTDVPASYYALSQIEYLTCQGIIAGTSNHIFSPNASATRIEFAKMISLARGWSLATPSSGQTFSDVSPSNPLYPFVETAYAHGAISGASSFDCAGAGLGYPCFLPNAPISRAQAAVITVRAFGWPIDTSGGPHFSDVAADNFAYGAIETCYNRGVVNGIGGGLFAPNANVTRAQLAVMLYKALTLPLAL